MTSIMNNNNGKLTLALLTDLNSEFLEAVPVALSRAETILAFRQFFVAAQTIWSAFFYCKELQHTWKVFLDSDTLLLNPSPSSIDIPPRLSTRSSARSHFQYEFPQGQRAAGRDWRCGLERLYAYRYVYVNVIHSTIDRGASKKGELFTYTYVFLGIILIS